MFIGEYTYLIDEKKRVAVPAKFRRDLGQKAIITRGIDKCLVMYPMKEWQILSKKLEKLPTSQLESRGFVRIMLSGASEVQFDKLGRILIPDYLKEYSDLKKNVAILGLSNRVEFWDKDKWEEYKQKSETEVGNMAEKLKELGI